MVLLHCPDTNTKTDTDKMCEEPMGSCIGLSLGFVQTLPNIIIEPNSIGLGLRLSQRKHTITDRYQDRDR